VKLLRITAPHLCAGIVLHNDRVVRYAPILYYMRNWGEAKIRSYVERKGWEIEQC